MHKRLIEEDLDHLRDRLLVMGGSAERAIALAVRALVERDSVLAEQVILDDDEIDKTELAIDEMCVDILVLKQPAASDLRFVISTARVAPQVERMADHAVNIAKHALALNDLPELEGIDVSRMAKVVQEMLIAGLDAFTSGDPQKAQSTISRDDEVDAYYDQLYLQLIRIMSGNSALVEQGVMWAYILKHLERIADYVTNICEQIVYMAQGQVIKHTVW